MPLRRATGSPAILAAAWLGVLGCAAPGGPRGEGAADPLQPLNRVVFAVNGVLDQVLFLPAAFFYETLVPPPVRRGVSNVLGNLLSLDTVVNDFAQGKGRQGRDDLGRFLVNTTVGVGGIFDVATGLGLEEHSEDFGKTLASWGVGEGPYVVLPLVGPCTLRDAAGVPITVATHPAAYAERDTALGTLGLYLVERRARLPEEAEARIRAAEDPYVFVREAYLQSRRFDVAGGRVPVEEYEAELEGLLDDLEDLDALDLDEPEGVEEP